MKTYLVLIILLLSLSGYAQQPSCCVKPTGMALLASNKNFIAAHEDPLPFVLEEQKGKMISFPVAGGKQGSAYAVLPAAKTEKVLFVFHEWWGLNDYIKREAETIQSEMGNVAVYAVDLYDGEVATEKSQAAQLAQGLKPERASAIIKGLLEYVGKSSKVSTLGWCMGGGWALQASILAGPQGKACVMYYGFPEKDKEKLKQLKAPVLYIRAEQDSFITKAAVDQFADDLKGLEKKVSVKSFNAVHAFANPSNPYYNKEYAAEAHKLAMDFLKKEN